MSVDVIPAKAHSIISFQTWEFYVAQIPYGQVLTEKRLLAYLRKLYGDEKLDVFWDSRPYEMFRDPSIPFWRLLSATGLVQSENSDVREAAYVEHLEAEGHRISATEHGHHKVDDYSLSMADPAEFRTLPADKVLFPSDDPLATPQRPLPPMAFVNKVKELNAPRNNI